MDSTALDKFLLMNDRAAA